MIKRDIIAQIILDFQKRDLPKLVERNLQINLDIPLKRAIVILFLLFNRKTFK